MGDPVDITGHPLAGAFRIDAEGAWFHNGERITHERTWKLFSSMLDVDENDRVFLSEGKVRIDVEVDDAPLVVTALRLTEDGLRLRFHDDTHDVIDPGTIHFKGPVPYCLARKGLEARFSTAAYVQLCDFVEETEKGFLLVVNGERFVLPPQGT